MTLREELEDWSTACMGSHDELASVCRQAANEIDRLNVEVIRLEFQASDLMTEAADRISGLERQVAELRSINAGMVGKLERISIAANRYRGTGK